MDIINALLLIVGGVLALSGIIVAKQPNAKDVIDKLVPYQALIGVGLLVLGVLNLLRMIGILSWLRGSPLFALSWLTMCVASILLGFMFGMSQIAKWLPGNPAAEQKGMELIRKLAPYQVILGIGGVGASLIYLLYRFGLLSIVAG
jgi:hypothetical protein